MDIGDIGKIFDNTPAEGLKDVVAFFMDHRDELDKIIGIVQSAPAMLTKMADGLGDAGDNAKTAAVSLAGNAGKGGAAGNLTTGAGTLNRVGGQLGEAAEFLGDVAQFMAGVDIPNVTPKFANVAGVKIVSGIDIGKDKLLADPAKRLADTSKTLTNAKGDLAGLADNLEDLARILTMVGGALDKLGDGLKASGAQAAKLFD
jgi:ABC-type transporter Mla subunit MlaD